MAVSSPRLLIVDDEASVRVTLAANLELAGFEVLEASTVAEAVEQLRRQRFDMVISDVRMPGKDGVAGVDDLRAIQPDVPVVFVTGYDADGTLPAALAKGAYTVLPKPLTVARLVDVVRRALTRPIVLVVDDEESFLDTAVESLRDAGLRVERAHDAASSLAVLDRAHVDVCVMDLVLGEEDGVTVFADLRAREPDLSVIAMTCHDVTELIREMMRSGAEQCLRKPLDFVALAKAIGRVRGQHASGGGA